MYRRSSFKEVRWLVQQEHLKFWVIGLVFFTIVLLVWHQYGMNRSIVIDRFGGLKVWTFDDRTFGGGSEARLKKADDEVTLYCHFSKKYTWPFCDMNIWFAEDTRGLDLSGYNAMEIDIATSDPSVKPIRIFLRNYNAAYSVPGNNSSLKVNELDYSPSEEKNPFIVPLSKFQVAIWWINENNIPPRYAESDLSNIVNIGVGFSQYQSENLHSITLRSVKFHGKWISRLHLQSAIIAVWLVAAMLFLGVSFWRAQKAVSEVRSQKKQLEQINAALELERNELETLATRDVLTGAYNRVGFRGHLHAQTMLANQYNSPLSIIFIDIDHFKEINDGYGHDVGDVILRSFVDLMRKNTRSQDVLCRWGGDEFILLCTSTVLESVAVLAEKLRAAVERHHWTSGLKVTCSFGAVQMREHENIGDFFKRADKALYKAKSSGRNSVCALTTMRGTETAQ